MANFFCTHCRLWTAFYLGMDLVVCRVCGFSFKPFYLTDREASEKSSEDHKESEDSGEVIDE